MRNLSSEEAVAKWLDQADESGEALVLEALQIRVLATVEEARISGVLPTQLPDAIGDEPASDYLDFKEQPGLPFDCAIHLASSQWNNPSTSAAPLKTPLPAR